MEPVGAGLLGAEWITRTEQAKDVASEIYVLFMLSSLGTWARVGLFQKGMPQAEVGGKGKGKGGGAARWFSNEQHLKNNSWNSHGGKLYSITTCEQHKQGTIESCVLAKLAAAVWHCLLPAFPQRAEELGSRLGYIYGIRDLHGA